MVNPSTPINEKSYNEILDEEITKLRQEIAATKETVKKLAERLAAKQNELTRKPGPSLAFESTKSPEKEKVDPPKETSSVKSSPSLTPKQPNSESCIDCKNPHRPIFCRNRCSKCYAAMRYRERTKAIIAPTSQNEHSVLESPKINSNPSEITAPESTPSHSIKSTKEASSKFGVCTNCFKEAKLVHWNRCYDCFMRSIHGKLPNNLGKCKSCSEIRSIVYKGACARCYKIDRETRQHNRKASETASPTKSADSSIVSPRTTNKIASLEEANIPTPTRRGPGRPRKRPLFSDTADAVASSSKNVTSSQRPPVSMQHLDKEFVEKYLMKELPKISDREAALLNPSSNAIPKPEKI